MSIKLHIRGSLYSLTKGKQLFELNGRTVGECLNQLANLVPAMEQAIFYETREGPAIRSRIQVKVNEQIIYTEDLAKEISDGDEIYIKMTLQ